MITAITRQQTIERGLKRKTNTKSKVNYMWNLYWELKIKIKYFKTRKTLYRKPGVKMSTFFFHDFYYLEQIVGGE